MLCNAINKHWHSYMFTPAYTYNLLSRTSNLQNIQGFHVSLGPIIFYGGGWHRRELFFLLKLLLTQQLKRQNVSFKYPPVAKNFTKKYCQSVVTRVLSVPLLWHIFFSLKFHVVWDSLPYSWRNSVYVCDLMIVSGLSRLLLTKWPFATLVVCLHYLGYCFL